MMYDEIYEVWRKESESEDLQVLPKDFYSKLAEYIRKGREERRMLDEKTAKAALLQAELDNVKKMISKLVQLRYEKILRKTLAGETVPKESLTEEEEEIYRHISMSAEVHRKI